MTEVKLDIRSLESFAALSLEAARRLDREDFQHSPSRISFESMEGLLKALTPNRWRLLGALRGRGPSSVRGLSQSLGRDYRGVHADVAILIGVGLIERDSKRAIVVPWSRITVDMAFDAAA